MRVIVGADERRPITSSIVALGALSVLTLTVLMGFRVLEVVPLVALIAVIAISHRVLLRWHILLAGLLLVILFIPIKRYALPAALPFELEPYRVAVALIALAWLGSLLIDPRVRLRRSGLEFPIAFFALALLASVLVNANRVSGLGLEAEVAKSLSFFASFFVIFYLIVSVMRTQDRIDLLVKILALGGAVIAVFAVIESRTGYNLFNHLSSVAPVLRYEDPLLVGLDADYLGRAGRLRVYASAQHPIALAAALVMLVPLAVYLAYTSAKRWWIVAGVLTLGALATVSRTGVLMLMVVGLVFLFLRTAETKRLWPMAIPLLLVVYFALPDTLGSFKSAFFPEGGLVAEQQVVVHGRELAADGRIADIGPSLEEFRAAPLFGSGFGTRITSAVEGGPAPNARILDNQWLSLLLQTGVAGVVALLWLFLRFIRRCGRLAKRDTSPAGWLLTGIVASVAAYAVGMLTFDAFSFIQVTFLLFILLGLGAALYSMRTSADDAPQARAG
jgi:hypothetical protein